MGLEPQPLYSRSKYYSDLTTNVKFLTNMLGQFHVLISNFLMIVKKY